MKSPFWMRVLVLLLDRLTRREHVFVGRSRDDYARGIKCAHCPNVIQLGGEIDGMTCMTCGAEVCMACLDTHEKVCR